MNQNVKEAQRWMEQAEIDSKAAEWNMQGKFYADACFKTQQAAEKAIKAFLFLKGERAVISHSTFILAQKSAGYSKDFEKIYPECKSIDKLYIPTRYPDSIPDGIPHEYYTEKDAQEAIKFAHTIISFIKNKITQTHQHK